MARVEYLGWGRSPLELAGEWIARECGEDLSDLCIALPGARSGRILGEKLARRLGTRGRPPRILTSGALTDEFLELEGPLASRLARTLAWEWALRQLSDSELDSILARIPERGGPAAPWVRLAEEVRGLFGEVAAEGLTFGDVAKSDALSTESGERARWHALAQAQTKMLERVRAAGFADPHVARQQAIAAGRLRVHGRVLLVGVVEGNRLMRELLAQPGLDVTALVFAPPSRAADFDEFGLLAPDAIVERGLVTPLENWQVVEDPEEQAQAALDALASFDGEYAAEEITIGVANAEVTPYLKRRLHALNVRARDAAGRAFAHTRPARLCAAIANYAQERSYRSLCALLRHPDICEPVARAAGADLPSLLDRYQARHLPDRVNGVWHGESDERDAMERMEHALVALLGLALDRDARPLSEWAAPLRELLLRVYGELEIEVGGDPERELVLACEALGVALDELAGLPDLLDPRVSAAEALELVLRGLSTRALPPAAERAGEATIELLGWLELGLDDAPALVVTGFEDGLVPETLVGDAFLPDGLRRSLGLVDNQRRLARDLYSTELLLNSRRRLHFITGRKSRSQDPLLPSRILFHGEQRQVPERVRRFIKARPRARSGGHDELVPARALPRRAGVDTEHYDRFRVTSFRTYIDSPYNFYLQHVLGLETLHDRHHELDPLGFGSLAHDVLQAYGEQAELKNCADAERIREFLEHELQRQAALLLGESPLPAVALQIDQMQWRLERFARDQAQRIAEGWRIAHVEWSPQGGAVELEVGDRPAQISGRIDRIDFHESGAWAIWDYKTSEKIGDPARAHRAKDGVWKDLQLPLYRLLAAELGRPALPALGLISIGGERKDDVFLEVRGWDEDVFDDARREAASIVAKVRRGELWEVGAWRPWDPVYSAIGGLGLVATTAASTEVSE